MDPLMLKHSKMHILLVGGTGMLLGLAKYFLQQPNVILTVIARHSSKELEEFAQHAAGSLEPLSMDYRNTTQLQEHLSASIKMYGPLCLAICWIHSHSLPAALQVVAQTLSQSSKNTHEDHASEILTENSNTTRFPVLVHIVGSASADPSSLAAQSRAMFASTFPAVRYRTVALGWNYQQEMHPGALTRWLTHEEICEGVQAAALADDSAPSLFTVGRTTPWSDRPSML